MSVKLNNEIKNFWNLFLDKTNRVDSFKDYKIDAWSFGNTKELADELGALVMEGKKTATCSILSAYKGEEDEIPQVGRYSVLCDGDDKPLCIIFLTHTWICKYNEVEAKHAFEEGEGDRTLEHWREVHHKFFSAYEGFNEESLLVCERFTVAFK